MASESTGGDLILACLGSDVFFLSHFGSSVLHLHMVFTHFCFKVPLGKTFFTTKVFQMASKGLFSGEISHRNRRSKPGVTSTTRTTI